LSTKAEASLEELKKYFGRRNLVTEMRKKMAAHADIEEIRNAYRTLPHDEMLVDYISENRGNCLYYSSELVRIKAMCQLAHLSGDPQKAVNQILKEINRVSKLFGDFTLEFMKAFMVKYVMVTSGDIDTIVIDNCPRSTM
jgi:hypothetical protein